MHAKVDLAACPYTPVSNAVIRQGSTFLQGPSGPQPCVTDLTDLTQPSTPRLVFHTPQTKANQDFRLSNAVITMLSTHSEKLTRRMALALIVVLQTTHFVFQVLYNWGPHGRQPKMRTMTSFFVLYFFSRCAFSVVERKLDIRVGRHVISGRRIDALLWWTAVWSAVVMLYDGEGYADGRLDMLQVVVYNVVMHTWMLGRLVFWMDKRVDLVEREDVKDEKANLERVVGEVSGNEKEKEEV